MRITKYFVLFFVAMSVVVGNVSAAEFKFNHINTRVTACDTSVTDGRPASASQVFYVNGQNRSEAVWDEFQSTTNRLISDRSTSIRLWESDTSLVSGCDNQAAWGRYSEYAPANKWVVATAANCTFNKPTDKNKRNVQFVFNVGTYGIANGNWTPNPSLVYATKAQATLGDATRVNLSNISLGDFDPHTNECLDVELRYCGDGILEPQNGETCDPEDPKRRGFGNGGCDTNTCQPINNPTCESISVSTNTGTGPTDINVTCEGFKADSYKIDCGNGQTINSQTGTCNYTTGDTYTPQCFVNDTITSNSCSTEIIITNLDASIAVDKVDANVFDLDSNVGNDTQSVQTGDKATFKITVTNDGDETLKNIKLIDTVETSCATVNGGVVNLQAGSFINMRNQTVAISYSGAGNHNNSTLEPKESFSYTCTKPDTISNYDNEVRVIGIGVNSEEEVKDEDDTRVVVVGTPGISVIKRDANERDKDGNEGGNDSQTVGVGDTAVFHITVKNDGTENLKDIELVDALAAACASNGVVNLAQKTFMNGNGQIVNVSVSGQGNHSDAIFQVGEIFVYTCEQANTQDSYTNLVKTEGTGITSGQTVTDQDTTEVVLEREAKIQVIKQDANSNDEDTKQFNDTQTVLKGDDAVFNITIKNVGTEDLKNITLSDPQALACGTKLGTVVDLANGTFMNASDVSININYLNTSTGPHNDDILQIGEEFSYSCSEVNTTAGYINKISVTGVGVITGDTPSDDDTSVVVLSDKVFDLALRKTLSTTTPGPFSAGDRVTYDITVFNQGNVAATNVKVIDYIPAELSLVSGQGWDLEGNNATRTIASIAANSQKTVTISFTIKSGVTGNVVNLAEIESADGGTDCDSTPNGDSGNDGTPTNDDIGTDCDQGGDEDDHDPEIIDVGDTPVFDLALRKTLSTTTPGPFSAGDRVTYDITVFNQGNVAATNVKVIDYIPAELSLVSGQGWDLEGNNATRTIASIAANSQKTVTISFTIKSGVTGNVVNLAEIESADGGTDCDSTPNGDSGNDGTPTNDDIGTDCDQGGDEDDHDPEIIDVGDTPVFDLALRKTLSTTTPGPFSAGDRVTYDITVFNQGNVAATNVKVIDYIPAELSLVSGQGWDLEGNNATRTIASIAANSQKTVTISFTIKSGVTGNVVNLAEIESADGGTDCDSTPNGDSGNDGTPTNDDIGTDCDQGGDEDDHDPEIIDVGDTPVFDLALRKTLSTTTPGPFSAGDRVTYDITVFNQGNVAATNVKVIDYIPTGLTLANGSSATQTIVSIAAGTSESISISFTIDAEFSGTVTNFSEISSADGGIDCDSTPDSTNGNTPGEQVPNMINDDIGSGCQVGGDEDDHDLATIVVDEEKDFDLALRKTLSPNTPGPFAAGDTVTYDIIVYNQGEVDATNIVIADTIPNQLTLVSDSVWTEQGGVATTTIPEINFGKEKKVSISFTINTGATGEIKNIAEIQNADGGEDCDSTPNEDFDNDEVVNDEIGGKCSEPGGDDEDDHDPEIINIGDYDLALSKQRVGTEELTIGSTVNFNIVVTNQGEVDSGEVVITDYIPSELSLVAGGDWDIVGGNATQTITNIEAGKNKTLPISFTINEGAKDSITNFAEISSDSGQDCDSTPDATNENTSGETDGTLVNDETGGQCDDMNVGDEDDHDLEIIPVADPVFDLALRKTLSENTQAPFVAGDRVIFEITVFNQGNLEATNVVITDYIPDELTIVNSNGWQVVDGRATKNIGTIKGNSQKIETIIFTINDGVTGSVENLAEIASASGGQDCDSTPDTDKANDGTVIDDAIGSRCDETDTDEDDHDPETIVVKVARDLELIKSYNGSQTEFAVGDTLTYDITVKNTGTSDLTDLKIEDHYGTELELSDADWTNDTTNNIATLLVPRLDAGDTETFPITFTIASGASGEVRNAAAICAESEPDCDPQPPESCEDSDEVNNPDGCVVIELEGASIQIDKTDANDDDQNSAADIQRVDSGDAAVFKITVTNNGNKDLTNIVIIDERGAACAGSVELPNIRVSSWDNFTVNGNNDNVFQPGESFSYECSVPNATTDYTNVAIVTADPVDTTLPAVTDTDDSEVDVDTGGGTTPGNPGSGGSTYRCEALIPNDSTDTIKCEGNSKVESFYLNCGGTIIGPKDAERNGGERFAEFSCTSSVAQCFVYDDEVNEIDGRAWRTSNTCRTEDTGIFPPVDPNNPNPPTPTGPVCGNGIIEIGSNPNNPAEQCDLGSKNGPQGPNEAYCSNSCKIELPIIDPVACANSGTNTNELCVLTFPNQGEIVFNPGGQKIIGHGTNPIDYNNRPSITNKSDYDLVFDQFCIQENGGKSSLIQGARQCSKPSKYSNGIIYPGETVYFTYTPTFTANKGAIPANADYGETKLSTSLVHDGFDHKNSYFASDMTVRVARPSVATVGGGTSFIKNDNSGDKVTGDIYDITLGTDLEADENKNFVGTSVNTDTGISSFSETLDNSTDQDSGTKVVETVEKVQENFEQDVATVAPVTTTTVTGSPVRFDSVHAKNYNGLSNVYVIEGKNVIIDDMSQLDITQPTTFIVQGGGYLEISTDIETNHNVAFVVRGGDIKIGKDVEFLDGTYVSIPSSVSIPSGSSGGNILATAESSTQLQVFGSLYGSFDDLVNKRNYIASDGDQLSVGTVVSFGSGIFSKPAPLVSQFIGEYLESTKVAR